MHRVRHRRWGILIEVSAAKMLRLSDSQMRDVIEIAAPIPYALRAIFLRTLAAELGDRDGGDGEVHRAALRARQASCRACRPADRVIPDPRPAGADPAY